VDRCSCLSHTVTEFAILLMVSVCEEHDTNVPRAGMCTAGPGVRQFDGSPEIRRVTLNSTGNLPRVGGGLRQYK
jgi:hypothetical protein